MNFRNPIFTINNWIDCEIEHPIHGWIPFSCNPDDKGAPLDAKALYDSMKPFAAPCAPPHTPSVEQRAADIRAIRNTLLGESDWTQLPDTSANMRADYVTYRQALRDIPQQDGFPEAVLWPAKPDNR